VGSQQCAIDVVEAAYRLDCEEPEWLTSIAEAVRPVLDGGFGVSALTFRKTPSGGILPSQPVFVAGAEWLPRAMGALTALTRENRQDMVAATVWAAKPLVSTRAEASKAQGATEQFDRLLAHSLPVPMHDLVSITIADPTGVAFGIGGLWNKPRAITERDRTFWAMAGAHMAAGFRLREGLGKASVTGDAVLTPNGKCLHAEGPAKSKSAREILREAARAMDRARGALRRKSPEQALEIWKGLCAGRWSLVDSFESDGRRYVIARPNEPRLPDPRALSERERQVVAYAALGRANKLIAYTLGLSVSTVATHLASAMRKLGVRTRVELVKAFASLEGGAAPGPGTSNSTR